jgi:predicted secreted Zn-dependent protease
MSCGLQHRVTFVLRPAIAGAALLAFCVGALAEVKVTIDHRDHVVEGSTASGLVRSMNANPVRGDHGNAYASIHPTFNLSVDTRQSGGLCRADVSVRLHFVLTLPRAASPGAMNSRTRAAWNSFTNFARSHEAHHQASYTSCAKSFVARAERQSAKQCMSLQSDIRKSFTQMKRDCEALQRTYDRSQARHLPNLSLFAQARAQRRNR